MLITIMREQNICSSIRFRFSPYNFKMHANQLFVLLEQTHHVQYLVIQKKEEEEAEL